MHRKKLGERKIRKRLADNFPRFISPMLARPSKPFDSNQYLFEIKWDGIRALVYIDSENARLINRRGIEITNRYPEFDFLSILPEGLVLDGEIIIFHDGKPDFELLLSRENSRNHLKIRELSRRNPATYIVFDLLYKDYCSTMSLSLTERRQLLMKLVDECKSTKLLFSDGIIGNGREFYRNACSRSLEGVVAKKLDSQYHAGKRSNAWKKIKRVLRLYCSVIGFIPREGEDFQSLVIASNENGKLRYIGKVGSGFSETMRRKINHFLWSQLRQVPIIDCGIDAKWINPGLYCKVRFFEHTKLGILRAPVFEDLITE